MTYRIITLTVFLFAYLCKGQAKNGSLHNDQQWLNLSSSIPDIPVRKGLAGSFIGIDNNVLIVAGGSYFDKPLWERGRKVIASMTLHSNCNNNQKMIIIAV